MDKGTKIFEPPARGGGGLRRGRELPTMNNEQNERLIKMREIIPPHYD